MPRGLVPTWDELLVELPWLLFPWCCICQVWFLKHSVSPTYSLLRAKLCMFSVYRAAGKEG